MYAQRTVAQPDILQESLAAKGQIYLMPVFWFHWQGVACLGVVGPAAAVIIKTSPKP